MAELSTGAVLSIFNEDGTPITVEPTVQVLSIKKVTANAATADRYRMIMSDGEHFIQAMLATQLNHLIARESPAIDKNSVIKLTQYACNVVQGRKIIICLAFEPLYQADEKIGNPIDIAGAAANNGGTAEPAPQAQAAPSVRSAPAPQAQARRPAVQNNGAPIYPIESLSPYQNKWTIKARVSQKSDIRHWTNAKGEGKLFSVNLLDESGEIKATGFNEQVDTLYPMLEEGKVFLISRARVNIAKKQFSNLSNEYEITFERNTEVTLCEDQDSAPKIKYDFVELAALSQLEKDATVDVLAIVTDNGDLTEFTAKTSQKQMKKRDLTVCDRSGYSCRVTLWGRMAETWVETDKGVFAFKNARVGDFNGKNLSMGGQSTMAADPDIQEAHDLRGWYDTEGATQEFTSQSAGPGGASSSAAFSKDDFKTLDRVEGDNMGYGDKPDFFSARATIVLVKGENMSYPACPSENCNKKVTMDDENSWRCEKCDKLYSHAEYRYIMSMCVADHTGQQWVSAFNDVGQQILGVTADALNDMKENDSEAFDRTVGAATGKLYNFSLRAKTETYGDQTRCKVVVSRLSEVDWVASSRFLLADIDSY